MVGRSHQQEMSPTRSLLEPGEPGRSNKKKTKKRKKAKADSKPNKWADRCMYAELLEMRDDDARSVPGGMGDGLPDDLETGWVAIAPVPVGKRCLAVTHQSSGIVGVGACLPP